MLIPLLDRWARSSQLQARRNAMIASTRLTQRRIEREEVDRYLATASRVARAVSAHRTEAVSAHRTEAVSAHRTEAVSASQVAAGR